MNQDCIRAVWEVEVESLELQVIRAERLVKTLANAPVEPWDPPAVPGEMPEDLALRAHQLLERRELAMVNLAGALDYARLQLATADLQ
jgi:hypothetical protein